VNDAPDPAFERLLDFVRDNRGFDFTGYKRPSLVRRVRRRMADLGVEEYDAYQDYLEVHPDEFTALFNTILINVTSFFRDEAAWEFVNAEVVPRVVEGHGPREHIRVWCAGVASGEEAYTVAMLLAEQLGSDRLVERAKVYATDVDEDALTHARTGVYDERAVATIPESLRDKYLEPANGGFAFRKELRRALIFGRHDLISDAPISRVDLIVCRNTLMYFNSELQTRIYRGFHFALNPDGFLFLGKSEMLLTRTDTFLPLDLKHRVFARVPRPTDDGATAPRPLAAPRGRGHDEPLTEAAFETSSVAQIVVDAQGVLVAANNRARNDFRLSENDFGRPFHDLELSYRPLELRSRIDRAAAERSPVFERAVPGLTPGGDQVRFDVEVTPLVVAGDVLGSTVTFTNVSRSYALQEELERSRRELETAYEEIQSTVEELETTNEELQSTNEELETTNEELQSTNEELETMNEELQSTNDELETINTELRDRTAQLNQTNAFLESVLASVRTGVVVLDSNLTVESWNPVAEELWGLRAAEVVGKSLFTLDFGLPVDRLREAIRGVLSGESEFVETVVDAIDRRGRELDCKVTVSRMRAEDDGQNGAILLMDVAEA
jgi:two-component system CheB/CheR fusion protein